MKKIFLLSGFLAFIGRLRAQTWSQWFRQDQTQITYDEDQIAALGLYDSDLETGYLIDQDGLLTIDTTTSADRQLHSDHFSYLKGASNGVLGDPQIMELTNAVQLLLQLSNTLQQYAPPGCSDLASYLAASIREQATSLETQLTTILSANTLQMTDAQRLQAFYTLKKNTLVAIRSCTVFLETLKAELQ